MVGGNAAIVFMFGCVYMFVEGEGTWCKGGRGEQYGGKKIDDVECLCILGRLWLIKNFVLLFEPFWWLSKRKLTMSLLAFCRQSEQTTDV